MVTKEIDQKTASNVIKDGPVTYTGFDPKDNKKIWVEEKRDGKYTYVCCQRDEFSRPYICIVSVTKDMLPEYENYLTEFPRKVRERVMSGETGFTFWHGLNTYWFFDKNEAIEKARSILKDSYNLA